MENSMIPVILSGGSGARLWPVSRLSMPKQFCEFLDESLFAKTVKRLKPLGSPWVVTVNELKVLTERALKEAGVPREQALYEPMARNTAPAIAFLCKVLELRGLAGEVVGIFPADHLIDDEAGFHAAVRSGAKIAASGAIVTLGVKPTYPATGYGYIETASVVQGGGTALRAVGFREKPNETTAREFISRGGFFWNAGMFIFKASQMIQLLSQHAPTVWEPFKLLKADLSNLSDVYSVVMAISIDYAVMERLNEHVTIPCTFEWSDLGSWDAIAEVLGSSPADKGTQLTLPIEVEGRANFVFPIEKKIYALVGVDDLIVVDTDDALLVAKRGKTERVKDVVDLLKSRSVPTATQHTFEVRPWGRFSVLADADDFKSKTITVDPGQQLSYQSHEKRAEHWIIVKGSGEVVLDGETIQVSAGKHVLIPLQAKHRIRNTGQVPLMFVEVQLGSYFGEGDIKRYEDDYKRV
jgi:mannose-1-phosphate guanylyltransferase/mannose-1-phosphate guanylyltransferase/mannose-6-phosphate isomerase